MISKSGYSVPPSLSANADVQQVVMYCKEKLIRGDSEFSFEELRAQKYNQRRKHEQWGTCTPIIWDILMSLKIILISGVITFFNR